MSRSCSTVTCGKCQGMGHNMTSCKGKRAADREIPKGENKEKKAKKTTNGEGTSTKAPKAKNVPNGEGTSTKGPKTPKSKKAPKAKKGKNGKKDNGPIEIGQGSQAPPTTQE
ncbi:hypothetical protein QL285_003991 [Trifolium repens]|nr:hypothetical protein QL285_003991 [Trifolium repens]